MGGQKGGAVSGWLGVGIPSVELEIPYGARVRFLSSNFPIWFCMLLAWILLVLWVQSQEELF